MSASNTPRDGDYELYLKKIRAEQARQQAQAAEHEDGFGHTVPMEMDTVPAGLETFFPPQPDVKIRDDDTLELSPEQRQAVAQMQLQRRALPISDEELARQALEAGGADNDPGTPE